MIFDCMVMCFVLVLFLHSLQLMMEKNCLNVVITIIITTVEEKSGDAPLVVRTVMEKVMMVPASNFLGNTLHAIVVFT